MGLFKISEQEKNEIRLKHEEAIKKFREKVAKTKKGLEIPTKKTT